MKCPRCKRKFAENGKVRVSILLSDGTQFRINLCASCGEDVQNVALEVWENV